METNHSAVRLALVPSASVGSQAQPSMPSSPTRTRGGGHVQREAMGLHLQVRALTLGHTILNRPFLRAQWPAQKEVKVRPQLQCPPSPHPIP